MIILIIAVGIVLWAAGVFKSTKHHKGGGGATVASIGPVIKSVAGLKAEELKTGPFFWAGPQPGQTYEFTRSIKGNLYVRYVPRGSAPGVQAKALIVTTYPFPGGYYAIKKEAKNAGVPLTQLRNGAIVYQDPKHPKSIYVGFKKEPQFEVVVYDPNPTIAATVAESGKVAPITG